MDSIPLTLAVVTTLAVCCPTAAAEELEVPAGRDFKAIAAGGYHSIALRRSGKLVGWGWNDYGQSAVPDGMFLAITAGHNYVAIAAGRYHNVALRRDGSVVAWGDDEYGQASVPAGKDFTAIACGSRHSIALRRDGSITAWGSDELGQTDAPSGTDFVAVSAGGYHNVALHADGSAVAWGRVPKESGTRALPAGKFTAVDDGGFEPFFAIALRRGGTLVGWGEKKYGQLDVPTGNNFVAIAAGYWHGLALRADGTIADWGRAAPGPMRVTPSGNREGTIPEWRKEPPTSAVQTLYRGGVPHTDRQGRLRIEFDPTKSLFPIGIYGYADDSDWDSLVRASFNTITHAIRTPENFRELLDRYNLQVIWTGRGDREYWKKHIAHFQAKTWRHRLLAHYCIDEPYVFTGSSGYTSDDPIDLIQSGWRQVYSTTRDGIQHFFPDLPVYVNVSPEVDIPQNGWGRWIQTSDIGCLDHYPFYDRNGVRAGTCGESRAPSAPRRSRAARKNRRGTSARASSTFCQSATGTIVSHVPKSSAARSTLRLFTAPRESSIGLGTIRVGEPAP